MRTPQDFIEYKDDVFKVLEFLKTKHYFYCMAECYILWEAFSDTACAQFLGVDDKWLGLFWDWLNEDSD